MATVARLHPRLWDGRRLLQFLTGLALIALAFAVPSLSPAPEVSGPASIVTVVDAPVTDGVIDLSAAVSPSSVEPAPDNGVAAAPPSAGSVPDGDEASAALCELALPHSGADQRTVAGRAPPAA
ncbi:hypothetical protein [Actinoplanes sp. RD1]|uniref:hypothetical protein n=1 Tax=Actinoplanes sp. RD1 TaxID=3064538 RepID=UPI00274084EC|nr:hypothetical protein [Actinoplanes sp. RD1]